MPSLIEIWNDIPKSHKKIISDAIADSDTLFGVLQTLANHYCKEQRDESGSETSTAEIKSRSRHTDLQEERRRRREERLARLNQHDARNT